MNNKASLLKTTCMEMVSWCIHRTFTLCSSVFGKERLSATTKRESKHQQSYKTYDLQYYPVCKLCFDFDIRPTP